DTNDEWITTRTGIKERRVSHVPVTDLAWVAAERALAAAGIEGSEIDLVVLATCTPDKLLPASSSKVQDMIGATRAGAMDINAACSGFLYAYSTADKLVRAGAAENAIVIGAERLSPWLDFTRRNTAVLFGDGAGAIVIEATDDEAGVLALELGSDGSQGNILCVGNTGSETGPGHNLLPDLTMDGPEVFKQAVTRMGEASTSVVEDAGWKLEDVDLLVPHQANVRIIDATARRMQLPPEKVFVNIASYGNTSAATIPIALTEALEENRIRPGANLVFAAFGGGLTWAAAAVKWGSRVQPIGVSDASLAPTDATALELLAPNLELYGRGA
ncbi:MAG: ketoacyl-ACP synthase III, partial [Acidimicrobiia bacterium]|nr:ketoacyl-ACP synthase III [Acidimicrobiia bacterium]